MRTYLYFIYISSLIFPQCVTQKCENITQNAIFKICKPIKECANVLNLLNTKPITEQTKVFIKTLKCGDDTRFPKVWCEVKLPSRDVYLPDPYKKECGYLGITRKVIGGENAAPGQYPWIAMLEYRLKNGKLVPQCGGSSISARFVLTAAHCLIVTARQGKLESILLGELDVNYISNYEKRYQVNTFVVHPMYEASAKLNLYHHDIALIRLTEEVSYTTHIRAVCLPSSEFTEKQEEDELTVAGWGLTGNATASEILQRLVVPLVESKECTRILAYNVTATQLCAGGEEGKNSCKGDSGGPLTTFNLAGYTTQIGIVSISIGRTCGAERPNIYTNVQTYVPWIRDAMADCFPKTRQSRNDDNMFFPND